MIKNIVFDMGGVLINWDPDGMLRSMNLSEEDRALVMNTVFKSYHWSLLDAGYYDEPTIFEVFKKQLPEHLHSAVEKILMDFGTEKVDEIKGMPELVKTLKDNGYGIYLLSNAGPRHPEYWKNVKGHEYFDGVFVSAMYKMFKPEPRIFTEMTKTYGLKAEECVFIDDLAINCAGAFLAGLKPIVFKGKDNLLSELDKLGVNCH